jgi:UDP-N-acetylmuramoylalanine--D-glutamate ligase
MIPITAYAGRKVAVFGMGASGRAAVKALLAGGATVLADDDDRATLAGLPAADLRATAFDGVAALVLSPGVPLTHPAPHWVAAKAKAAGVPVIGDIELFAGALSRAMPGAKLVAITGTNGKSTTTALIGHVLQGGGRRVAVGGNLGTPALALDALGPDGIYVLELSSYQIDLTPSLAPDVGVLLNITPDHLDRHGGMDGYVAVKTRLFAKPRAAATAVVGMDDVPSRAVFAGLGARWRRTPISALGPIAGGIYFHDGRLIDVSDGASQIVLNMAEAQALPGRHNGQNAAAACAAARALGLDRGSIAAGIRSFPGLAHRMERVGDDAGILYVNDSKATNADAAAKALDAYEAIYWIAGGIPKEGGITTLAPWFPRIARAYLIGEAAPEFAGTLAGKVPTVMASDLAAALLRADADARAEGRRGAVVLLSPACASFDQFANFSARGDAFRSLVQDLLVRRRAGA